MISRRDQIRAKIMANVDIGIGCGCHLWRGSTSGNGRGGGYGRMSLDGATVAVHIAAWVNESGLIPPRKQLDHLCRTRRCVNAAHLELVTPRENARRRSAVKSKKEIA